MDLEEIVKNKKIIIELLKSTNRKGIDNVIKFLSESDFFIRQGSYRHHQYKGGLAAHSLGVYNNAMTLNKRQKDKCSQDSIIIAGLLHDICKIPDEYIPQKVGGGHGSRSIQILNYLGLELTDEEKRAIRFHMAKRNRIFEGEDAVQYEIAENETLREIIHESDTRDASMSFIRHIFF